MRNLLKRFFKSGLYKSLLFLSQFVYWFVKWHNKFEFDCRDDEVLSLDWCELEPKEAIRLLRTNLTSLGGIPSIKYLRVIVGTNDEDTTKGARKRMILKQLEKESIEYEEEENGQAILIRVDKIDPKRLSFAKNKVKQ
ncbi:hypothetical protein Ddye_026896 [Dipteronia dyeriana]|uniref:Uncharacterized protein n=1 Tax=Dipteronia dyeriana TaxID=168575 RepID=A0AAD9TN93_9ROSI|nr:hypothetical protein Ddye_026896 [Dipteronia dyeriana]